MQSTDKRLDLAEGFINDDGITRIKVKDFDGIEAKSFFGADNAVAATVVASARAR